MDSTGSELVVVGRGASRLDAMLDAREQAKRYYGGDNFQLVRTFAADAEVQRVTVETGQTAVIAVQFSVRCQFTAFHDTQSRH